MNPEDKSEKLEQLLKQAGPHIQRIQPGPVPVPDRVRKALHAVLDRKFPVVAELTAQEMEVVLLKVLAKRPMDGFELARALEKANLKLKEGGEGVIYGLLAHLESEGCLEARWSEGMVKTYHLSERGSGRLQTSRATASQMSVWAESVLATS